MDEIKLVNFEENFITPTYISWLNNSELMKYSEQRHKTHNYETCKEYLKSCLQNKDILFYAIINNQNSEHVGNINAYIDPYNKTADIGILIGKGGKGFGFLAWKKMISVLKEKKIRKITGGTAALNIPMIKIFKKSGMNFEFSMKDHLIIDNKFVDIQVFSIFI